MTDPGGQILPRWLRVAPDLSSGGPRPSGRGVSNHNLPLQLTSLVGRDLDVEAVGRLLEEERLVSLTGSGGVGKTRLALAVAAEAIPKYPGGVWLVELAAISDEEGVAAAALAAVGAHQAPGFPLVELLAMSVGSAPSLIVLDNCEHLIEGCARLAAGLLTANAAASVLATSREPLGVPGEATWRVPSLSTPGSEHNPDATMLLEYDAVRLFVDRARRARPSFRLSGDNAQVVARVCHHLDGIPLALELAAACCRQLSVEWIAEDLGNRFRILTGGARTALPRQRTLAASIDWSYDRLDPEEAVTFRRLGVFAGPIPLEAAEAVVSAAGEIAAEQVFDLLTRLADKSLLHVEDGAGHEPVYRLLESLRAYSLALMRASGELESARRAHAEWCLSWLTARGSVLHRDVVVDQIELLHDNFRAALDWALDHPRLGLPLLGLLARAWHGSARPSDAMPAVDRLLTDDQQEELRDEWLSAALPASVLVELTRGFDNSADLLRKAEHLATELGRDYEAALARWLSSYDLESGGAAYRAARQQGDSYFYPLTFISLIESQTDADPGAATQLDSDELIAACEGSTVFTQYASYVRAQAERAPGNLRRCIVLAGQLLSSRSAVTVAGAINMLSGSALLARDEIALELAVGAAERRLGAFSPTWAIASHRLSLIHGAPSRVDPHLRDRVDNFAPTGLHLLIREAIDAGEVAVAIEAAHSQVARGPFSEALYASCQAAATGDEGRWHECLQVAATHSLRLLVVDALEGLVVVASRAESWVESLRLFGAAMRLRDECEYRWRFGSDELTLEQAVETARQHLASDEADQALLDGRALPWAEAVAYARRSRGERKRPSHGWDSLTPTEWQVVDLVSEGLTNPQIGIRLLMGRATVKTHLEHIFNKIGVRSRSELASAAARRDPKVPAYVRVSGASRGPDSPRRSL